jgi:hypothetical protein
MSTASGGSGGGLAAAGATAGSFFGGSVTFGDVIWLQSTAFSRAPYKETFVNDFMRCGE